MCAGGASFAPRRSAPFGRRSRNSRLCASSLPRSARPVSYTHLAIVISHNHPNNTLLPSRDDVSCTLSLLSALQPLGVPLLDHIVVADQQAVSIRDLGYIAGNVWLAQAPDSALLKNWLKDAPLP